MATCTALSPVTASIGVFDEGLGPGSNRKLGSEDGLGGSIIRTTALAPSSSPADTVLDVFGLGNVPEAPAVGKGERLKTKGSKDGNGGSNNHGGKEGRVGDPGRSQRRNDSVKDVHNRHIDGGGEIDKDLSAFQFESVADDFLSSNVGTGKETGKADSDDGSYGTQAKNSNEEETVEVLVDGSKLNSAVSRPSHHSSISDSGKPGLNGEEDKRYQEDFEEEEEDTGSTRTAGHQQLDPGAVQSPGHGGDRDDQTRQMKSAYNGGMAVSLWLTQGENSLFVVRFFEILYGLAIAVVYMEFT